jgi:hypothetical protein
MQAERAPFVGIVLALLVVAVETLGLLAYVPLAPLPNKAKASAAQTWQQPAQRPLKIRCRR